MQTNFDQMVLGLWLIIGSDIEVGVLYVNRRALYLFLVSGLVVVVVVAPRFSIAEREVRKLTLIVLMWRKGW